MSLSLPSSLKKSRLELAFNTLRTIEKPSHILPALLAIATNHPRYLPEIKWVSNLWTHNIFRVWEMIFGAPVGVKPGAIVAHIFENGTYQKLEYYFTLEAACAAFESWIRNRMPRLVPVKVFVPAFAGASGPFMPGPYLFAIAYGSGTNQDYNTLAAGDLTSPSVSGSNTLGIVGQFSQTELGAMTATWNSVSCTQIGALNGSGANERMESFYIVAPAAGATTIHGVRPSGPNDYRIYGAYYTGAAQTTPVEASSTIDSTVATLTMTLTTTANACVMCWIRGTNGSAYSGGTNTTVRLNQNVSIVLADTSPTTLSAGSNSVEITSTSQQGFGPYWSIAAAAGGGGGATTPVPTLLLLNVG